MSASGPQDSPVRPGTGGPPDPLVRHVPAPSGPNGALVVVGVILLAVAAWAAMHALAVPLDASDVGPPAIIGAGILLVAVGGAGVLLRGRRHR